MRIASATIFPFSPMPLTSTQAPRHPSLEIFPWRKWLGRSRCRAHALACFRVVLLRSLTALAHVGGWTSRT
jgi:hypothetical protein